MKGKKGKKYSLGERRIKRRCMKNVEYAGIAFISFSNTINLTAKDHYYKMQFFAGKVVIVSICAILKRYGLPFVRLKKLKEIITLDCDWIHTSAIFSG